MTLSAGIPERCARGIVGSRAEAVRESPDAPYRQHRVHLTPKPKGRSCWLHYVHCKDQAEVDYYWSRLLKGGKASRCGWLEDKFGLSWQVVPAALPRCVNGKDKVGARRALEAMMHMVQLDVAKLEAAYRGD